MAHWDNVRKQYVADSTADNREGETDQERYARKKGDESNADAASKARFQDVKGGGLGAAGESALKQKTVQQPQSTTLPTTKPLSGAEQLEAMRKRRTQLTSY
jgi:hypothetical protein